MDFEFGQTKLLIGEIEMTILDFVVFATNIILILGIIAFLSFFRDVEEGESGRNTLISNFRMLGEGNTAYFYKSKESMTAKQIPKRKQVNKNNNSQNKQGKMTDDIFCNFCRQTFNIVYQYTYLLTY